MDIQTKGPGSFVKHRILRCSLELWVLKYSITARKYHKLKHKNITTHPKDFNSSLRGVQVILQPSAQTLCCFTKLLYVALILHFHVSHLDKLKCVVKSFLCIR